MMELSGSPSDHACPQADECRRTTRLAGDAVEGNLLLFSAVTVNGSALQVIHHRFDVIVCRAQISITLLYSVGLQLPEIRLESP